MVKFSVLNVAIAVWKVVMMRGMTDIHSHILYGVDDGAATIEESLDLLRSEYSQGVSTVICTPHFKNGEMSYDTQKVSSNFDKLQKAAKEQLEDINLYLGCEIMACNDMPDMLKSGKVSTLSDSRYVLVEFYPTTSFQNIESMLSRLLSDGYIPVLAHCERYRCLRKAFSRPDVLSMSHLRDMGAYMQVNASSVIGRDFRFAVSLIEHDLLHFVASDAHNMTDRGICFEKCVDRLLKTYNTRYIEKIFVDNPSRIIRGEYL